MELSTNPYSLIISGITCGIIFCIFLWILIKTQKNKNIFRKVNVQGNEIEIFEECEDSYFYKYLNEVLYPFENTRADVIVFEDMDRFNANRIFERLREVNTISNVHLKKEAKGYIKTINRFISWLRHPIRFFYLLRDDIFISKDRTKFFDYIVPVVPVSASDKMHKSAG